MQASGCRPHAAVFSSIIDVLWQTGIAWAQAKALQLFSAAVQCGPCRIWGPWSTLCLPASENSGGALKALREHCVQERCCGAR